MKKLGIVIVLAIIGGGAYIWFKKPELVEQIKGQVETMIAGQGWREMKNYREDFKKAKLKEAGEKDGFLKDFKEKMTQLTFEDGKGGEVTLVHLSSVPQALLLKFKSDSTSGVAGYAQSAWKQFFEGDADFSSSGKKSSEHAMAVWETNDGIVMLDIQKKDIEKLAPVEELPAEVKEAIAGIKSIITDKVKMEVDYVKLNDELNHCFDPVKFKELEKQLAEMKAKAVEMTDKYKELKKTIPHGQLVLIQKELDQGSIK
jgi:hypothetical protein